MKLIKYIYNLFFSLFNIRFKGYYTRLSYFNLVKIINKKNTLKRNSYLNNRNINIGKIENKKGFLKVESELIDKNLLENLFNETKIIFNERKEKEYKNPNLKALIKNNEVKIGSSLYKLATNEKIINTIANYLGVVPVCTYINLWYSPKKNNPNLEGSQLMHLDHEDFQQIKLFFFCEDVDKDTGPLVALDQKDSTNIQKKLGYNLKEQNKRISDNTLNKFKFNYLTGKKGDLYLVDTSQCFHAGSRTSKKDRYVIMIQYLTPYSYMKKFKKNNLNFKFDKNKMTNLEKTVFSF